MAEEPQACPFCGSDEHLSMSQVGSLTSDMPARPFRVVCNHLDHDTVSGPVAYGRNGAIAAWNTRAAPATPAAPDAARRPEQEPVAWRYRSTERDGGWNTWHFPGHPDLDGGDWDLQPLYANALPTLFQDGAAAWRLSGEHGNSYTGEVDRAKSAALLPGVTVTPLYASPQAGKGGEVKPWDARCVELSIAELDALDGVPLDEIKNWASYGESVMCVLGQLKWMRQEALAASPAPAAPKVEEKTPIDEATPRDREIEIFVTGPGARWLVCRWGKPTGANWGDRFGHDQDLPEQWITQAGFALDRRNGEPTHWREISEPAALAVTGEGEEASGDTVEKLARYIDAEAFDNRRRSSRNQHAANIAKTSARKLAKRILKYRPIAAALASQQDQGRTGG